MMDKLGYALRDLNNAAYAALRAGNDTAEYPNLNRQALRKIARMTDTLFETAGVSAEENLE